MAKRTGVIIWRDCNAVDVVIARVFSRIFSESTELEAEIARCRNNFNVKTCLWKWPEEHHRTRLVFFFETPVPSNIFFEGIHGAGLLRTVATFTFPSDVFASKDLIVPRRCFTNVSHISLIEIHSIEAKCESRDPCVLQFLISANEITSNRGVFYFRLENSEQYDALVNAMNESSLILTFEVWHIQSSFVFRTWSSTSSRVSVLRKFLEPYAFVALSEMDTSSVFCHLACRCFVCPKVTEIKDVTFESCFLEASVSPTPIHIAQSNENQAQELSAEEKLEWSKFEELPKPERKDLFESSAGEEDGENEGIVSVEGKSKEAEGAGDGILSRDAECGEVEGTTLKKSALPRNGVAKDEVEVEGDGKPVGNHDMGKGMPLISDGEGEEGGSGTLGGEGKGGEEDKLDEEGDEHEEGIERKGKGEGDSEGEGDGDGEGEGEGELSEGEGEGEGEGRGGCVAALARDVENGVDKAEDDGMEVDDGNDEEERKGDGKREGEGAGEKGEIGDGGNGAGEGQIGGDVLENYGMNEEDGRQAENAGRGRLSQSNSEIQGDGDKREIGDGGEGEGKGDGDKGEIEGGGEGEGEGVGEGKGEGKGDGEGEGKELEPDEKTLLRTSADSRDEEGENSGMADAMVVVGESDGKGDGQDKSEGEVSFFVFWF